MRVFEKIAHKNLHEVKIYREGVFWVAYEQSAYYFWKLKGYKPTKRFVKVVGMEVVSVGFPKPPKTSPSPPAPFASGIFPKRGKEKEDDFFGGGVAHAPGAAGGEMALTSFSPNLTSLPHLHDRASDAPIINRREREYIEYTLADAIDEKAFLEWKEGLAIVETRHATSLHDPASSYAAPSYAAIMNKIRNFDMSNKTPMECMLFLATVKGEIEEMIGGNGDEIPSGLRSSTDEIPHSVRNDGALFWGSGGSSGGGAAAATATLFSATAVIPNGAQRNEESVELQYFKSLNL